MVNDFKYSILRERFASKGKLSSALSSVVKSSLASSDNPIIRAQQTSKLYSNSSSTIISGDLKTKSSKELNVKPMTLDEATKRDIKLIQMRNYIDPKRFYKNPDKVGKVLHVGTVIEGPSEYKSARLTNKERKQTILDEVFSETKIKDYTKRKFLEIQSEKNNKRKAFKTKKKTKDTKQKKIRRYF